MPKIIFKKKSSTTRKPISSKTMEAATNLVNITNTSFGSSSGTTDTIPKHVIPVKKNTIPKHVIPVKKNTIPKHVIPVKKNTSLSFPGTPHSYRHVRINSQSYLIIATYLEKVEKDKKDKKPIKIGDKFMVIDPLSYYNEIRVTSIAPDKKTCSVLRINNNKTYTFKDQKCVNYKKMSYDFFDGKATTLIDTLKNQSFYIRTYYLLKLFHDDYQSDVILFKKA
jgi:hypothetical protein